MAVYGVQTPDYLRGVRRVLTVAAGVVLIAIFLVWRIDNARVEQLRISIVDRVAPSFDWTLKPVTSAARLVSDFRSYARVYDQNAELRRELQRMQGWREAALQLEQKNAQLLALNNVRLNPRLTFVTGEVMADSGINRDDLAQAFDLPNEFAESVTRLVVADGLVGSGKARRVTSFSLGPRNGNVRRVALEWEEATPYSNVTPGRRRIEGEWRR